MPWEPDRPSLLETVLVVDAVPAVVVPLPALPQAVAPTPISGIAISTIKGFILLYTSFPILRPDQIEDPSKTLPRGNSGRGTNHRKTETRALRPASTPQPSSTASASATVK